MFFNLVLPPPFSLSFILMKYLPKESYSCICIMFHKFIATGFFMPYLDSFNLTYRKQMTLGFLSPAVILYLALSVKCISGYPRMLKTCNYSPYFTGSRRELALLLLAFFVALLVLFV